MTSSSTISHKGFVTSCDEEQATIRLTDAVECHSCGIREYCGKGDDQNQFIVRNQGFRIGDQVDVWMSTRTGYKAITWAYLVPFLLILMVMVIGFSLKMPDQWIGLASLLILVPYFIGIYVLKDKIRSHFELNVIKS